MVDSVFAQMLKAVEQADTVPRVAYASEEGWATIQRMLNEDCEPHADVVARLKRRRS